MKVVHIESGLGNQMLSYCEYLALKKMNPDDDIYIENVIYDIQECDDVICQWNGYELEMIFGIKAPNIKDYFTQEEWCNIIHEIRETEFWNRNWNWPVHICNVLNKHGLNLINIRGNFEDNKVTKIASYKRKIIKLILDKTQFGYFLKRLNNKYRSKIFIEKVNRKNELFISTNKNILTGQWLALKFKGNNRELIDTDIRNTFIFPDFSEEKNIEMMEYLKTVNGVAIHARRGDMLGANGWCYKYGYFKRAVKYIKKHVDSPVFVFFTNTGSIEWCKENSQIFNLDLKKDNVLFIDWNKGENSFRDMQLMSYCKHAIITNSTFGWWGAYFIKYPEKITISPLTEIDTTVHC